MIIAKNQLILTIKTHNMKSILITIVFLGSVLGVNAQSDLAYADLSTTSIKSTSAKEKTTEFYKEIVASPYMAEKAKKLQLQVDNYDIKKNDVYVPNASGTYTVNFTEGINEVKAIYSADGDLLTSEGAFENVPVPYNIGSELAKKYPGWEFNKSWCYSSYSRDMDSKIMYKILLKKGTKTKTVKINPNDYSL